MNGKHFLFATLFAMVLLAVAFIPVTSQQAGAYDPWVDLNDDGKIDGKDIAQVAKGFGTLGTSITKAAIGYDSGWINITEKQGQYFNITPGFNLETTAWMPCIYGRAVEDGSTHQKYWYGYGMPGWNQTYGGTNNDYGYSVIETSDGGYAITGYTNSFGSSYQACLVKTSADNTMQWNQTYGGTGSEIGNSMVQASDGGYAIAGLTNSFGSGIQVYLVKASADGTMQWNRTYGGTGEEIARAVVQTSDGGYAIAGYTSSFGSGNQVYLVKTYADGAIAWNKTYGGTLTEYGYSMVQASDGGYAIAGLTNSFGSNYQVYLIKTYADGTMAWNKTYGGANSDLGYSVVQTVDGGYAIAGYTNSFDSSFDVYLVKTFADGTVDWQQTYGGKNDDHAFSVVQTVDGGYAIAGYTNSFDSSFDVYLVKTFASGNMQWNKTYGGGLDDYGYSVVQTSDGGYAIAGSSDSFGSGVQVYLVKMDALGQMDLDWGVTIASITTDALIFCRGKIDPYYNYIRVYLWVLKETP